MSVSASREAGPSAAAATKPSPPTRRRARLRAGARTRGGKKVVIAIVVVLALVFAVALYARTHSPDAPASPRAQGYVGAATNTGVLSPDWASGVETAWTLPGSSADGSRAQSVFVEGTTMYVTAWESADSLQIIAYDISSAQPRETWASRGNVAAAVSTFDAPNVVSAGEWLAIDSVLVSKGTGSQQEAPWGEDTPMAFVDEVVVTCSFLETCSGWTLQSGSWTRLWQTITSRQSRASDAWKRGGGRVVGFSEDASVLVPVDHHYNLQLVNARTGELATLGDTGRSTSISVSDFQLAQDGVIVMRSVGTMEAYDATGRFVDTFEEGRKARSVVPSEDGRAPTLAELKAFYSDGKASWTSGTARVEGDECTTVTFTPTADYPPRSVEGVKQLSLNYSVYCPFSPTQLRAATDGSAVFVRAKGWERDRIVVLDMVNNAHHAVRLTDAEDLIWAFDDLLIVTSKTGITALTPSSSGA
jgi:hypothetical protein